MQNAKRKLNRSGNSHAGNTIRVITHGFFGAEKLSASERIVFNALYSFAQKGAKADFTFSEIHRRYNVSYATVSRTMKKALDHCFARADEPCSYKLKEILPAPDRYFYVPDWLRFALFPDGEGTTDLTNDQIEVLSYILHQNAKIDHWRSTQASIARTLEIAPSTVSEAVALFERIKLLSVSSVSGASRAVNHLDRVSFTVDDVTLEETKKKTLQRVRTLPHAVRDADARSDRERFYAARQKLSKEHSERVRKALGPEFEKLERQYGVLEMKIAQEEYRKNAEKAAALRKEREDLKRHMRAFLEERHYTESDLLPRHICPVCSDTGWRPDGTACDCYSPPGGKP